jgi:putative transposase
MLAQWSDTAAIWSRAERSSSPSPWRTAARALVEHIAAFRQAFRIARQERPFTVDAIVVLPDHLHAILTLPEGDADFPGRWRRIKSLFSRHVSEHATGLAPNRKGEHALWQRRFWEHTVRDDADFSGHFDTIHFNPVRHGLVSRVRDWPHSSLPPLRPPRLAAEGLDRRHPRRPPQPEPNRNLRRALAP